MMISPKESEKTGSRADSGGGSARGIRGWNWPGGSANLKFALHFLLVDLQFKRYQNVFY